MIVQLFSKLGIRGRRPRDRLSAHYLKGEGPKMSEVFDDIIDRETDVARIAAVVASDCRFCIFRGRRVPVRFRVIRRQSMIIRMTETRELAPPWVHPDD
jgi:hypothetical protein